MMSGYVSSDDECPDEGSSPARRYFYSSDECPDEGSSSASGYRDEVSASASGYVSSDDVRPDGSSASASGYFSSDDVCLDEGSSSASGHFSSDDECPDEGYVSLDDEENERMSNISPNGRFKRIISGWQKGNLLGRGSFGSVYEGIADGGFFFAVKEVSLLDQGDLGRQSIYQLEQEIALLSQFEHENIVQYYGTDKDESNLYIFLELVTKGSLLNLYQKYALRDSQVSSYTRQILHGLKYLQERDVVHRRLHVILG